MSWTLYGARLETSDFGGAPVVFQPFTLPRRTRLKALRTWIINYNNPAFDLFSMQIWSDVGGRPGQLLHTFTKTYVPADLESVDGNYRALEIYFDFEEAKHLPKSVPMHLVPVFTNPTFVEASHIAWVYGFPDPNTSYEGLILDTAKITSTPFYAAFIGDDR